MAAYKDEQRGTWYVSFHYYDWMGKSAGKSGEISRPKRKPCTPIYLKTLQSELSILFNHAVRLYE